MVKILDKRKDNDTGDMEYLVKWSGNWADSWEPESGIVGSADDAIKAFVDGKGDGTSTKNKKKKKK